MPSSSQPFHADHLPFRRKPFLHFYQPAFIGADLAGQLLDWFEQTTLWQPRREEDFYEVADFNLSQSPVPKPFRHLSGRRLREYLLSCIAPHCPGLNGEVDVTAHRLTSGEKIKIHTDNGPLRQRFRIIIQVNREWSVRHGGLIMLFSTDTPDVDASDHTIYLPENGSAWGFRISAKSFHAVSPVQDNIRYSLTYTFY